MGEVVKPMMETRLQRMITDTSKLDRIRYRELQRSEQEQQLAQLKKTPLPLIKPSLTRVRDSKCGKCDVELEAFTKLDDWYMEPIDALTMKCYAEKEAKKGWWNRMKLCVFSLRKILSHSMSSLVIHPAQIKMMKNIQLRHPTTPLVFVLNSKSPQWDLLLVTYALSVNGINHLLAVDNQLEHIPIVGRILKEMNLTFCDKDEKIGDAQIKAQLQANGNILIVDDDDDKRHLQVVFTSSINVFFLPVSINSERAKKDFKLFNDFNLGIVKINFHEPYTAADLLKASDLTEIFPLQQADKVMTISKHLQYDIIMKRPIMSTNVVAFLLTTEFRTGASVSDLACKLNFLRQENRFIDFAFEGEAEDIVEHAIGILGEEFVEIKGDFIKARASSLVQLSEYASALFPHFALKSILIVTALSLKRSESFVDFNTLLTSAVDLCELLQCEINCAKPCEALNVQLTREFDFCSLKGIMHKPVVEPLTSNELRAQRLARQFEEEGSLSDDDDDGYQSRNANNEVTINEENSMEIEALKNVTMPIIDAYLTVAYCLKEFIGKQKFTEQEFTRKSVKIMREELEDGNCKFWESCSQEWVASALKCLQLSNMIEVKLIDGENKLINIHPAFNNSKSIKFLIEKINRFL